ncbi:hypothetical protein C9374_011684 [Naegleria lovaniensis]|uniref:Radical SAM core domain-containing protein n=1 Tax=Naegleria lovaniensis TaxID=51637 RepID=A0AA88GFT3_NAELO|nr:uncharacterized protein C9374_011684 [Naegleria lovaniensis]KAG2373799.1 hypothetical protein C9374_011684 [Naegleria lovaniensis]
MLKKNFHRFFGRILDTHNDHHGSFSPSQIFSSSFTHSKPFKTYSKNNLFQHKGSENELQHDHTPSEMHLNNNMNHSNHLNYSSSNSQHDDSNIFSSSTLDNKNSSITTSKKNLIGLTLQELIDTLSESIPSITPHKATRIFSHMYTQGQTSFHDMKVTITKREMDELSEKFEIRYPMSVCAETISSLDKTRKYLFDLHEDERKVEGVVMHFPEKERITMCVSSQVGCSMNCSFCHTGSQKLERNLTAAEIVGQVMLAKQKYHNFPLHAYSLPIQTEKDREKRRNYNENAVSNVISVPDQMERITHIVFMGQGEPLYNHKNVFKAVKILNEQHGLNISRKRIGISTCGVVPIMRRVVTELGVDLLISLHATYNDLRDVLVPINKTYPLEHLFETLREMILNKELDRKVTFEYVMLRGVNDSISEAHRLVELVKGITCAFHLIEFNTWPGAPYECSTSETIDAFGAVLRNAGIRTGVRRSKGKDIQAACGQLKTSEFVKSRRAEQLRRVSAQL